MATALGLLTTACATATHELSKADSKAVLAQGANSGDGVAQTDGQRAMAWGDKWTASKLFKRANDKHATLLSRFNLAASYQQTGRMAEAATLYRALIVDGHYVWVTSGGNSNDRSQGNRRFNIAEESAKRLAAIEAPAGPPAKGRVVSDATAINRDETAEVRRDATAEAVKQAAEAPKP